MRPIIAHTLCLPLLLVYCQYEDRSTYGEVVVKVLLATHIIKRTFLQACQLRHSQLRRQLQWDLDITLFLSLSSRALEQNTELCLQQTAQRISFTEIPSDQVLTKKECIHCNSPSA